MKCLQPHHFTTNFTMAKFRTAIIAAPLLLCFFTVSLARTTPLDDKSAAAVTTQVALPLSSADPALRLPTETDAKTNTKTDSTSTVPLAEITFRPVNGRFRHRSKRPCRHHFKFYPAMRENGEISYGNDMILASGENSDFEQPIARGVSKRIPGRWMRMHHHHRLRRNRDEDSGVESDDEEEEDRSKKVVFRRYDYDRFDREKKLKKLRKHFRVRNEEAEKKKKGGFMIRVRKFLDHYI